MFNMGGLRLRHLPWVVGVGRLHVTRQKIAWGCRPARGSRTGNQLTCLKVLFFPSPQLVFPPLGEITGKQKDCSNDHCGNRGDNLGTEFTH